MLSTVIVDEYHRINKVMASHLVAYVGFQILRKQNQKLDLYNFFRLQEEDLRISYDQFKESFTAVHSQVLKLHEQGKVGIADHLTNEVDAIIKLGLKNVGMYHVARPLIQSKKGEIKTQDLYTLYYYHNRLDGFNLDGLV